MQSALGCGLLALSAESIGAMEIVKSATLDYLRTRKQFGVSIGSFQALQHRMADLLLEIEQARSAVINAADKLRAPPGLREPTLAAANTRLAASARWSPSRASSCMAASA